MVKYCTVLCFFILFGIKLTYAQNYYLNNGFTASTGGTINTCTGSFYDSNPFGSYNAGEQYFGTFYPATANKKIRLTFTEFDLSTNDTLKLYDGPDTLAPLITALYAGTNASNFVAANIAGCISFKFVSKSVTNTATGWKASVRCANPCQPFTVGLVTTPPQNANSFIYACVGDTINFSLQPNFPNNNITYNQSVANCTYSWSMGGLGSSVTAIGLNQLKRVTNQSLGYRVAVEITDSNGCKSNQLVIAKIGTSKKPTFNLTGDTLCMGDTAKLTAINTNTAGQTFTNFTTVSSNFIQPPISGDSLMIPDGTTNALPCGRPYQDTINVSGFLPGQVINNVNDFEGVFLNMEHSFLGDLNISLIAPNGREVILKSLNPTTFAGNSSFLGRPVESGGMSANIAGVGYEYGFTPNAARGTFRAEAGTAPLETFIDNIGFTNTNRILAPGNYTPETPLTALIGAPLNGQWVIKICDDWSVDNGYLFTWRLAFNRNLYPTSETYSVGIKHAAWQSGNGTFFNDSTTMLVANPLTNINNYTFRIIDSAGCQYDTAVAVLFNPIPQKPNLGADTTLCNNQTIFVNIINPEPGINFTWSNGAVGQNLPINQPGTYTVTGANAGGCASSDTLNVVLQTNIKVKLGADTLFCASNPNRIQAGIEGNINQFLWSTGSTNNYTLVADTGSYWVRGTTPSGCQVFDTIRLTNNPINFYKMPNDTAICDRLVYQLRVESPAGSTVTWYDGTVGNSHPIADSGVYASTANYIGCFKKDSIYFSLKPLPIVSLGKDTTLCDFFTLPLKVSYPNAIFRWSNGVTDSTITIKNANTYWVEGSLNSCFFRDSINVGYKNCGCNTIVPNAFSPNGDGINDVFKPNIQCFPKDYRCSVFNRYGQLVFETREFGKGWDGTYNGKTAPISTYYYIISYQNTGLNVREQFTGSITILR